MKRRRLAQKLGHTWAWLLVFVMIMLVNARSVPESYVSRISGSSARVRRMLGRGKLVTAQETIGYMVSIRDSMRNMHVCTGTLVKSNFVLTSANCLSTIPAANLVVWIGPDNVLHPTSYDYLFVMKKICHPAFRDGVLTHDICLLQLNQDSWQTPVALELNVQGVTPNLPLIASGIGWSTASESATTLLGDLIRVQLPLESDLLCVSVYQAIGYQQVNNICIQGGSLFGPDWCTMSDWGGPLLNGKIQVGVASAGDPGACKVLDSEGSNETTTGQRRRRNGFGPSVYTRVFPNSEFITSVLLGQYVMSQGLPSADSQQGLSSEADANAGSSVGVVVGIVFGLLILAFILAGIGAFMCRRRQRRKREYREQQCIFMEAQLFLKMKCRKITIDSGQLVVANEALPVLEQLEKKSTSTSNIGESTMAVAGGEYDKEEKDRHDGLLFLSARGIVNEHGCMLPNIPNGRYLLYEPQHMDSTQFIPASLLKVDQDPEQGGLLLTARNLAIFANPFTVENASVPAANMGRRHSPAVGGIPAGVIAAHPPIAHHRSSTMTNPHRHSLAMPDPSVLNPNVPAAAAISGTLGAALSRSTTVGSTDSMPKHRHSLSSLAAVQTAATDGPLATPSDLSAPPSYTQLVDSSAALQPPVSSSALLPSTGADPRASGDATLPSPPAECAAADGANGAVAIDVPGGAAPAAILGAGVQPPAARQQARHMSKQMRANFAKQKRREEMMMHAVWRFGNHPEAARHVAPPARQEEGRAGRMLTKVENGIKRMFSRGENGLSNVTILAGEAGASADNDGDGMRHGGDHKGDRKLRHKHGSSGKKHGKRKMSKEARLSKTKTSSAMEKVSRSANLPTDATVIPVDGCEVRHTHTGGSTDSKKLKKGVAVPLNSRVLHRTATLANEARSQHHAAAVGSPRALERTGSNEIGLSRVSSSESNGLQRRGSNERVADSPRRTSIKRERKLSHEPTKAERSGAEKTSIKHEKRKQSHKHSSSAKPSSREKVNRGHSMPEGERSSKSKAHRTRTQSNPQQSQERKRSELITTWVSQSNNQQPPLAYDAMYDPRGDH